MLFFNSDRGTNTRHARTQTPLGTTSISIERHRKAQKTHGAVVAADDSTSGAVSQPAATRSYRVCVGFGTRLSFRSTTHPSRTRRTLAPPPFFARKQLEPPSNARRGHL